jgi:hypothetical protein
MKDEALDLAHGYLDRLIRGLNMDDTSEAVQVRDTIKQALAAPVQSAERGEPVAWLYKGDAEFDGKEWRDNIRVTTSKQVADWQGKDIQPLYTTPPATQPAPVQEPVATKLETQQFNCFHVSAEDFQRLKALPVGAKLYTTPPNVATPLAAQRQWVGLPDEEIREVNAKVSQIPPIDYTTTTYARAIEAKLKEKNT